MEIRLIFRDPKVKASSRKPAAREGGHMPAYLIPRRPGEYRYGENRGQGDQVPARGLFPMRAVREKSRTASWARTEN